MRPTVMPLLLFFDGTFALGSPYLRPQFGHLVESGGIVHLHSGHCRSVILSSYEQLLKRWDKLFALKQKFGNCPEWPTTQSIHSPADNLKI